MSLGRVSQKCEISITLRHQLVFHHVNPISLSHEGLDNAHGCNMGRLVVRPFGSFQTILHGARPTASSACSALPTCCGAANLKFL
jgi:hypothetical protein